VLTSAVDINYTGQILVSGTYNGQERSYLLTPQTAVAAGASNFEAGNIEFQLPAGETTPQAVTISVTPLNASDAQASLPVGQEALLALDISSNINLAATYPNMFPITLWFDVPFSGTAAEFVNLRILHGETRNGVYGLYDVTEAHDYDNRRISAKVDSFSPFVIVREVGPTINNVTVNKKVLWPANHQMVEVKVNYTATDNITGATINDGQLSVSSSEPLTGLGSGDYAPDWEVVDAHTVRLRAERAGIGNGRTYTIVVTCKNSKGSASTQIVTVAVPKNHR
jgi:hypothetical protein